MTTTQAEATFSVHLYSNCTEGHPVLRTETVMTALATCDSCLARHSAR